MTFAQEAWARGEDDARAAASWIADGNTKTEAIHQLLTMMEDGDPAVDDYLPRRPNLSGEFADDLTPLSLAREITGQDDPDPDTIDMIADAYEEAVSETFEGACQEELLRWVA